MLKYRMLYVSLENGKVEVITFSEKNNKDAINTAKMIRKLYGKPLLLQKVEATTVRRFKSCKKYEDIIEILTRY